MAVRTVKRAQLTHIAVFLNARLLEISQPGYSSLDDNRLAMPLTSLQVMG
jgi:hypothetical protein